MKYTKNFRLAILFSLLSINWLSFSQTNKPVDDFMAKGQYALALPILEKYNLTDSASTESLKKQAICHIKLGQLAKSKAIYEKILLQNPDSEELIMNLVNIAEKQGNINSQIKYYKNLLAIDSTNAFYHRENAKLAIKTNKIDLGLNHYEKALTLNPDDLESMVEIANIHLNNGMDLSAEPYIENGYKLDSTNVRLRLVRGRLFYRGSDFGNYIKEIEYTMSQGDTTAFYQRNLGRAYLRTDNPEKSLKVFKRLLRTGENTEIVKAGLGYAYASLKNGTRKDSLEAYKNFRDAIDNGTSDQISDYLIAIADLHANNYDPQFPIREYQDVSIKYQRPIALFKMADIYEMRLKDKEMATVFFNEYLRVCQTEKKYTFDCKMKEVAENRVKNMDNNQMNKAKTAIFITDSTKNRIDSLIIDDK